MRIYQALYRYTQAEPTISSVVGNRVYDIHAEQARATKYPALVIEAIDDIPFHSIGAAPTATRRPVNIYCMATGNSKAAEDLADTVYNAVINQQDAITDASGLTVRSTHLNGRRIEYEETLETNEKLYAVILEFDFIHDYQ
jgi:hypothetical protein